MTLRVRMIVEFIGTFWLVFGGCASAIYAAAGRFGWNEVLPYAVAQVLGAIAAAALLYLAASGKGPLQPPRGADHGNGDDVHVPDDHPRSRSSI